MITIEQFCTFFKPLDPDPDSGSKRPWIRIRNTAVIFHLSGQTACALHSPQFPSLPTVAHMLSPLAGIRCTKLAICTLSSLHALAMNTSSPGEPCSLEKKHRTQIVWNWVNPDRSMGNNFSTKSDDPWIKTLTIPYFFKFTLNNGGFWVAFRPGIWWWKVLNMLLNVWLVADNFENIVPMDVFRVDWVNLPYLGLTDTLALSALPGCRYNHGGGGRIENWSSL